MSNYYTQIGAQIVNLLQTSTKVRNVYNYENTSPDGYPAICVTPSDGSATFLDTMRTRREFNFRVMCYQERLEATPQGAESTLVALVDEIISIFENLSSSNLNNTVVFADPISVKFGYLNVPDADVRTAEITLKAIVAQ